MEVDRVQIISSLAKDSIPKDYIRPEEDQPGITTLNGPVPEIPVIDLNDNDRENLVRLVAGASKDWGIFQVVNHGIPFDLIEKLQHVGKAFFNLPQDEKEEYHYPNTMEGYGSKVVKFLRGKNWGDHVIHNVWPPSSINYQYWPQNPPSYRAVNEEYAQYLRKVVNKLFECLSLGLGLEAGALKEGAGGERLEYMMKVNYYPPCPQPDLALGAGPHTDLCTMTVLLANKVPGLQVFKDGVWIHPLYIPGSLIIFIGDQIEIMSNGKYKAVLHRVAVNKDRIRMSWPVFLQPPAELVVGPLPQLVDQQKSPPKYKAKKYDDYSYCKLNRLPQ